MSLTTPQFIRLLERVATAWSQQDTDLGLSCFCDDAVYMEPPNHQVFIGHAQLRPYFAALASGTTMIWHHIWFDAAQQIGSGEYTFGLGGRTTGTTGVAVVEVRGERISRWREYQRRGPINLSDFLAINGKAWEWHIGNYP